MSFRFSKRIKLAPGISLNLGKRGGSISLGPKGAKLNLGTRGVRATAGIPGTGISYSTTLGSKKVSKKQNRKTTNTAIPTIPVQDRLTLGFFKRLVIPKGEQNFVDGCRELSQGNTGKSVNYLKEAANLADAAFLAGFLQLKK